MKDVSKSDHIIIIEITEDLAALPFIKNKVAKTSINLLSRNDQPIARLTVLHPKMASRHCSLGTTTLAVKGHSEGL
jgi:hypothetical protein